MGGVGHEAAHGGLSVPELLDEGVAFDQRALESVDHAIEGGAELADLVAAALQVGPLVEVAAGYAVGDPGDRS